MSLALIQESAKEVRRLAVAGSPLAVGDFRLKKLIPPLEQAGAKVPVFAQVAKAIHELVNAKEAESAALLLNMSTLLNAILYTQGATGTDAPFRDLESFNARNIATNTPARVLKPIIEALSKTGSGRFEVVKSGFERGAFNDLRLIQPAIRALDDVYPELADFVAEKILPAYGQSIIPLLRQELEVKGKRGDARCLAVLHQLDPAGAVPLCKTAMEEGSTDVKVAAIACLGKSDDHVPLLLEQSKTKNKAVREAALEALAAHDGPNVLKVFTEMIAGKTADLIIGPLRSVKSREVFHLLLREAHKARELALKNDGFGIVRFSQLLGCLEGRNDVETQRFLLASMAHADKLVKAKGGKDTVITGADLVRQLADLLNRIGSPECSEAILAHRDKIPVDSFRLVLHSALRTWPAGKFFKEFAPLLEEKKGSGKMKCDELLQLISIAHWDEASRFTPFGYDEEKKEDGLRSLEWDKRWLDAAIKADQPGVVCCLIRPGHPSAVKYLLGLTDAKRTSDSGLLVRALARAKYPQVTDCFIELVRKKTKAARYLDYELQFLFESARHLPPGALSRLEGFTAELDEKFIEHFLEALNPLRSVQQST